MPISSATAMNRPIPDMQRAGASRPRVRPSPANPARDTNPRHGRKFPPLRGLVLPAGNSRIVRQGGYLLLEMIVAFAIALLALDALYGGGIYGLTTAHAAARADEALIRGRSLLSEAADQSDIQPGLSDGDQPGGYHWRLAIRELSSVSLRRGPRTQRIALYDIQLTMSWHGTIRARQMTLETRRTVSVRP